MPFAMLRRPVPLWAVPLVLVGLAAAYVVGVALLAGYGWRERDWNNDGRTSLSEFLESSDVWRRDVRRGTESCVEYFRTKDGQPVRIDCPSGRYHPGAVGVAVPKPPRCAQSSGFLIEISSDAIAELPLGEPLAELARRCPDAIPTTREGFESTAPALAFPFDSLTVVAFQHESALDMSKPADGWEVRGCGGVLPRGVSTCASWAQIVATYGDSGEGNSEFGPARIRLRALPGYDLELDVTDRTVGSLEVQPDLSRVPPGARLVRIMVAPGRQ